MGGYKTTSARTAFFISSFLKIALTSNDANRHSSACLHRRERGERRDNRWHENRSVEVDLLTSCIPSVHPLYTDQNLIFDPMLVGVWADKEGKATWTFTKRGEKAYTLVYVDQTGEKGDFAVHLLKVGDLRFLDLYPADPDLQQNDFFKVHLLRVHTFIRLQHLQDSLQLAFMKPDWIKSYLQEHPDAIKHERVDDGVVLTAQPKELQAFLIHHDKTPDAWDPYSPMTRRVEKPRQ